MILGMSFSTLRPEIIERLEGMKGNEEGGKEGRKKEVNDFTVKEGRKGGRSGDNNDVLRDRVVWWVTGGLLAWLVRILESGPFYMYLM